MRTPEHWFLEDLKLINPKVYPHWSSRYKKWFIVKDFHKRIGGLTYYDPVAGKNFIVEVVLEDEKGKAVPLDGKVLRALRKMSYEKNNLRFYNFLNEVDKEEEERAEKAQKIRREMQADFLRKANKFMTKTVFT